MLDQVSPVIALPSHQLKVLLQLFCLCPTSCMCVPWSQCNCIDSYPTAFSISIFLLHCRTQHFLPILLRIFHQSLANRSGCVQSVCDWGSLLVSMGTAGWISKGICGHSRLPSGALGLPWFQAFSCACMSCCTAFWTHPHGNLITTCLWIMISTGSNEPSTLHCEGCDTYNIYFLSNLYSFLQTNR
jgi:hypothetical protein